MSPSSVQRWSSTLAPMFTSPRPTSSTWPRSTWRRTACVIGSVWLPTRRTRTSYVTSESAPTMMRMMTRSKDATNQQQQQKKQNINFFTSSVFNRWETKHVVYPIIKKHWSCVNFTRNVVSFISFKVFRLCSQLSKTVLKCYLYLSIRWWLFTGPPMWNLDVYCLQQMSLEGRKYFILIIRIRVVEMEYGWSILTLSNTKLETENWCICTIVHTLLIYPLGAGKIWI